MMVQVSLMKVSITNKGSIDGEEAGKTPAAQQYGLETQRTKVPEEKNFTLT